MIYTEVRALKNPMYIKDEQMKTAVETNGISMEQFASIRFEEQQLWRETTRSEFADVDGSLACRIKFSAGGGLCVGS